MNYDEEKNALQELLTEAYLQYVTEHRRKVGDNEFARFLGVNVGSYNQWINGNRGPSYDNVLKMAPNLAKLDPDFGKRIFDVTGFERVSIVNDPQIQFIADRWRLLSNETRKQILDHIKEESEGR